MEKEPVDTHKCLFKNGSLFFFLKSIFSMSIYKLRKYSYYLNLKLSGAILVKTIDHLLFFWLCFALLVVSLAMA